MSPQDEHDLKRHLPPIDESLIINTRLSEIERRQREEKAEEKEYKRRQLRFNRGTLIFTGLLFLTSAVSDWFLFHQTRATTASADAATTAANTAKDALNYARKNGTETSEANRKALESTLKQGREALDASIATSRMDERAWVHIIFPEELPNLPMGSVYFIFVNVVNSGKTSARVIRIFANCSIIDANEKLHLTYDDKPPHPSMGTAIPILAPNAPPERVRIFAMRDVSGKPEPVVVDQTLLDHVKKGDTAVVLHGKLFYEDAFGKKHWLRFCHYMNLFFNGFGNDECLNYNDFDR